MKFIKVAHINYLYRLVAGGWIGIALTASGTDSLYWTATDANGAFVIRANGDGSNPTPIVSGSENILGPNGIEHFNGWLYWPDQQLNEVRRVKPDGTGLGTFTAAQNPYDVFVTPLQGFWSSQERNYLDTMLLDGTGYQRLLSSPAVNRPFAVEVTDTHIYWSQVTGSGAILRSDRSGANIVTLIQNAFVYDLQVAGDKIFFADNNYPGGIKRANLDGSGIVTLVPGGALFNGICVTSDAIYWSAFLDSEGGGIRRSDLNGSNPVNLYNSPPGTSVRGVVVLSEPSASAQPRLKGYRLGAGAFQFTLDTEFGKSYGVETSTDLAVWKGLTSFTAATTSTTVTNPLPSGSGNLFFRIRTQ